MNNRGFSLMELMIVIALIGILSAIGTFGFSQYSKKAQIASQTRLLYGDLMEYRIKAMYEKKNWTIKIAAAGYGIYSSADTTVAPVKTVTLKYDVTTDNADDIIFNTRGLALFSSDTSNLNLGKSACVASANDAAVDAVVLSTTRVQIGKRKEGLSCAEANIDTK